MALKGLVGLICSSAGAYPQQAIAYKPLCIGIGSTFALKTLKRSMDLLQACDEMKAFIETAQKLIETWEQDPDNYSKLEDGLNAMKAELEKFND